MGDLSSLLQKYLSVTLPGGRRPDQYLPMSRFSWPAKLAPSFVHPQASKPFPPPPKAYVVEFKPFYVEFKTTTRLFCRLWTSTSPQGGQTSGCNSRGIASCTTFTVVTPHSLDVGRKLVSGGPRCSEVEAGERHDHARLLIAITSCQIRGASSTHPHARHHPCWELGRRPF